MNISASPTDESYQDFLKYRTALIEKLLARGVPTYMHKGILNHVLHGRPVGDFLTTLLVGAGWTHVLGRADATNMALLHNYWMFLTNDVPGSCWSSLEHVRSWQKNGGYVGMSPARDEIMKNIDEGNLECP